MNVTLSIGMFKVEVLLLEEFAAREGTTVEGYCRNVLNAHIRAQVEPGDGFVAERRNTETP